MKDSLLQHTQFRLAISYLSGSYSSSAESESMRKDNSNSCLDDKTFPKGNECKVSIGTYCSELKHVSL